MDRPPPDARAEAEPADAPPTEPLAAGAARTRRWRRRALVVGAGVAVVAVVFLGVTALTGLTAPGALHRYRYADLADLADRVNTDAGEIRTPDDCWRQVHGTDGPLREIAGVDLVRSRVVVRMYSGNVGAVDAWTYNTIIGRLDAIVRDDPDLSWGMVQLEASPDGWSPLVSCRLVTRGYPKPVR